MSFLSLIGVELKKIQHSKILWILLIPIVFLWVPAVINADLNFDMQLEGISPENNFLVQSFMGFAWFMYPASLVICTVLLNQTERSNRGILKMFSLPISRFKLCLAKFVLLLILAVVQMAMMLVMYFICAAIASSIQDYQFMLSPFTVLKEARMIYLSSIPMATVYWMLATCIQTPIFSIGIGLATIVPSVLAINTKMWFLYPMCYPFMIITSEMHKMSTNLGTFSYKLFPWIPVAMAFTVICLVISCIQFGQVERR